MHDMLDRWLHTRLEKLINQRPAVALIGARKVGKTTLAKLLAEHENCASSMTDFEQYQRVSKFRLWLYKILTIQPVRVRL